MCGRFTSTFPDIETLGDALGVHQILSGEDYRPRYNLAPTDRHWVVREKAGTRELVPARWGLVSHGSSDASGAARRINARAETVRRLWPFRAAFERRRCVVPADGFFEWVKTGKTRTPLWYHPPERGLLLFAGLYASWQDPRTGAWQRTFSIITTPANDVVRRAHARMPALLTPDEGVRWMRGPADEVAYLLRPAPTDAIVATQVSSRVNSVKNDDPGCLSPESE